MIRFGTLYLTLCAIGTLAIMLLAEAPASRAIPAAMVACLLKTLAVKIHDWIWERTAPKETELS